MMLEKMSCNGMVKIKNRKMQQIFVDSWMSNGNGVRGEGGVGGRGFSSGLRTVSRRKGWMLEWNGTNGNWWNFGMDN